jgi:FtsH-binding integral membrane protein
MEPLIPIFLFLGAFAMVFGLRYLSNKENMAMIERGINPKNERNHVSAPTPFLSLKFGLLLVGLGIGLLLALAGTITLNVTHQEAVALYFGCLSIFGGLGLIVSYIIEKNWIEKHSKKI